MISQIILRRETMTLNRWIARQLKKSYPRRVTWCAAKHENTARVLHRSQPILIICDPAAQSKSAQALDVGTLLSPARQIASRPCVVDLSSSIRINARFKARVNEVIPHVRL